MRYQLMHKNVPVLELTIQDETATITKVGDLLDPRHLPVGVSKKSLLSDLNHWWQRRSIPASRSGLREAMDSLNISAPQMLLTKCLGLSLSDQYWVRPENENVSWESVNFFQNPFSGDVGDILFGGKTDSENLDLMSPDNTSDGWLKKRWTILNGKRCLLKGGSGTTRQEPYNEALASWIMEQLQIPHVTYRLVNENGAPYSLCEDFITPDTELVSAWHVMQTQKKENHVSTYQHYLNCCEALGLSEIKEAVDQMLAVDYLIANQDRHLNNFGVIRNANTLEYVETAPVFDSGTSLWFDQPTALIQGNGAAPSKPFRSSHEEQIRLVTDFSWLDFSALKGVDEVLRELTKGSVFVDETRCDRLCRALTRRLEMLEKIAHQSVVSEFFSEGELDLEDDFAFSGNDDEPEMTM